MAGLPMPGQVPAPVNAPMGAMPARPTAQVVNIGGFLPMGNVAAALAMDQRTQASQAESEQNQPVIMGLAAAIDSAWTDAKEAKQHVEQDMIEAMYARRGEYTPDKLQQIKEQRQPPIYMMIAAAKMRQVESLLRDVMIGTGAEKPWTLAPTPVPELPPEVGMQLVQQLAMEIQQAMASGFMPTMEAARARARQLRDEITPMLMEEARKRTERMEQKMEDQHVEGGFLQAMDQFITDLATFKTAFVSGPVIRKKARLTWGQGGQMTVEQVNQMEWDRLDPFDVYPARYARSLDDGPLIIKRRLSRANLTEMIGVEGYSEASIRSVLDRFGDSGLREWLSVDSQREAAEGKQTIMSTEAGMIDALQYWGSASGKMLRDWGMDETQVPDPAKEYQIEAWKIGPYVIKATLNPDPLGRRNVFGTSFQTVPGTVWGNAPYDLMRDCQDMCNAAARALAANLGISSGPQVAVLSNRMPAGEDITEMYPWKIWQFESDPMGSTADPVKFFQPQSNAAELMTVYERFSLLADEYTGIPRYMAGFNGGEGGAGRTASGIGMMIGNASKIIKQVAGNVDLNIVTPVLEAQYYYNMRYGDDPDLKGDVKIIARGSMSVAVKEAAQVRMNEFLQLVLNSPVVMQMVGMEGLAELLRPTVKRLDINPDKLIPPIPVLRMRMAQMLQMQMQQAQQAQQQGKESAGPGPSSSGQELQNGAPVVDNFSPPKQG